MNKFQVRGQKHSAPVTTQTLHLRHQFQYRVPWISSTCSSPVTTALGTTEGNVMPPIAGPSETDRYSFQESPSAPTPPVRTSTPRPKCSKCVRSSKKERPWQKNTTAWKSGLLNWKKNLSCCKLLRYFLFSFTISFKFPKCMKFYR